jgi:hypothetical protein
MLNLYSYERARKGHFSERVYLSNAVAVLREAVYRIEMARLGCAHSLLVVRLTRAPPQDLAKRELHVVFVSALPAPEHGPRTLEERWTQYVVSYVQSDRTDATAGKRHVFRSRCVPIRKVCGGDADAGGAQAAAVAAAAARSQGAGGCGTAQRPGVQDLHEDVQAVLCRKHRGLFLPPWCVFPSFLISVACAHTHAQARRTRRRPTGCSAAMRGGAGPWPR